MIKLPSKKFQNIQIKYILNELFHADNDYYWDTIEEMVDRIVPQIYNDPDEEFDENLLKPFENLSQHELAKQLQPMLKNNTHMKNIISTLSYKIAEDIAIVIKQNIDFIKDELKYSRKRLETDKKKEMNKALLLESLTKAQKKQLSEVFGIKL